MKKSAHIVLFISQPKDIQVTTETGIFLQGNFAISQPGN